jgi:hypothetical protein
MGGRYLHLLHSEHKEIRAPLLLWVRWCGSWLRQPWECVSVLTDALQRLAVHLALGLQMEPSGNELVEQGL